jgi:hypothetical protein
MKLKNLLRRAKKRGQEAGDKLLKRHYLDTLYESFKRRDMTRRAFKRAYARIMDPKRMVKDAEDLALRNQVLRSMRRT